MSKKYKTDLDLEFDVITRNLYSQIISMNNHMEKFIDIDIEESNKRVLVKIQEAYQILTPLAQTPLHHGSKPSKKGISPILWVVLALVVVGAGMFVWKPWKNIIDPELEKQFITIKAQADLLATQNNWNDALVKYQEANKLISQLEVR